MSAHPRKPETLEETDAAIIEAKAAWKRAEETLEAAREEWAEALVRLAALTVVRRKLAATPDEDGGK